MAALANERNQMSDAPLRNPDHFPATQASVILPGPAGDLEALTDVPEPEEDIGVVAVLCHSEPDDAGNLHNKVVHMMERALREMGARTVRMNFRGAGASEGEFDQGFGESEDLLAVAAWVRQQRPDDQIWLGGFGFGCYVTARACQKLPVACLISVAPPVEDYDFKALPRPQCPWLVIQGDADERISADAVYAWAEAMEEPPQLIKIEDANHSFHRRLMDLRGVIKNGIRRQLRTDEDE